MSFEGSILLDRQAFAKARAELGAHLVKVLGYFREDGLKSVDVLEEAARAMNAAAMVLPAHTLKGEAQQFGAEPLAELAEKIEVHARLCVERRDEPSEVIPDVASLRALFDATLALLERETNPLATRRPAGFGRRLG